MMVPYKVSGRKDKENTVNFFSLFLGNTSFPLKILYNQSVFFSGASPLHALHETICSEHMG